MTRFVLVLALLASVAALSACTPGADVNAIPVPSDAPVDLGHPLNLTLAKNVTAEQGTLTIVDPNSTGTIYIYTYCGIAGALLRQDAGAYRYVFPVTDACMDPSNASFTGSLDVPLASIPLASPIGPGRYEFKLYYATVAPGVGVREANLFFTVTG